MKVVKYILIIGAVALGLYLIAGAVAVGLLGSSFKETYTKNDLIENFKTRQQEILSLSDYFNSIVPKNMQVEIEFKSDTWLARLEVADLDSTGAAIVPRFLEWDLETGGHKVDSIARSFHWDGQTLLMLKAK